ncbi:unnamed protein product [Brachionus calyciflorus]|uniref:Protein SHQ1 homolog n=1 Tax=Brachionus calyciflorus TaxID=104777 RepID=A0A813WNY6_9BILA|nr:unnamed protein product [Brachionus calyciflorus]
MITPTFKLDQNDEYLFVNIRAPYANLNEVDLFVENNDLRFYCKPYYLRLNLPGNILENDDSGTYDFDEKTFKFKFQKENKGEKFEGLDLLTKLLTPNINKTKKSGPLIEELNAEGDNKEDGEEDDEDEEEEDGDLWYLEQNISQNDDFKISDIKYGFAQTKSSIFQKLGGEYLMIIDNLDPDSLTLEKRNELRIENENEKFDPDHYLADYYDDSEMIESSILMFQPDWFETEFTDDEIHCLKNLPKKNFLLDKEQKFYAFCGLVDILFSYCYNNRINLGESNVESGWTISKLSSTLSWFDTFKSLQDCLVASFRRSLCFPLYRNWKLSQACFKDLIKLMRKDTKVLIKVLIEIRKIFIDADCRYILNDLYINEYIVWIQYVERKKIDSLIECLQSFKITKEMVDMDLECIELSGKMALEEAENQDDESSSLSSDDDESNSDDRCKETKLCDLEDDVVKLSIGNNENSSCKKPLITELN